VGHDPGSYAPPGTTSRDVGVMPGLVIFFAVAGVIWVWQKASDAKRLTGRASAPARPRAQVDITVLRLGLDARVRPFVQKELDRIARRADTATKVGLGTTLQEIALMLRRVRGAWVYGGADNHDLRDRIEARAVFQRQVADARAAFQHERVRNAGGVITVDDAAPPRADAADGLVLVTLVVAARQHLYTVTDIGDGEQLARALDVLAALAPERLVAMEAVWTPADPGERLTSVALEQRAHVFPIDGARVGKVICAYCRGPFPAEQMTCPHCGAPARDAA
jgi:uncharacterized membrane protein